MNHWYVSFLITSPCVSASSLAIRAQEVSLTVPEGSLGSSEQAVMCKEE
jgi:hypothetical protein